mgnify:CR=1 FL=1
MSTYNTVSALSVLLAVILLSGCTSRIGDFTTVSTKNVNMDAEYQRVGDAEGSNGAFLFLSPDLKLAVDDALDSAGADARYLTDARIFIVSYPFYSVIKVQGDAWEPVTSSSADSEVYRLQDTNEGRFLVSKDGSERVKVLNADEINIGDLEESDSAR